MKLWLIQLRQVVVFWLNIISVDNLKKLEHCVKHYDKTFLKLICFHTSWVRGIKRPGRLHTQKTSDRRIPWMNLFIVWDILERFGFSRMKRRRAPRLIKHVIIIGSVKPHQNNSNDYVLSSFTVVFGNLRCRMSLQDMTRCYPVFFIYCNAKSLSTPYQISGKGCRCSVTFSRKPWMDKGQIWSMGHRRCHVHCHYHWLSLSELFNAAIVNIYTIIEGSTWYLPSTYQIWAC